MLKEIPDRIVTIKLLGLILGVVGLMIATFILLLGPLFNLKTVICQDETGAVCPPKLMQVMAEYQHHSLFKLSPGLIKTRLETDFPELQVLSQKIIWPNTYQLNLAPRLVAFQIQKTPAEPMVLIDNSGKVIGFDQNPPTNQDYIVYPNLPGVQLGESVDDPLILFAFRLVSALSKTQIAHQRIFLETPNTVTVELNQGKSVLFSNNQDLSRQVTSLQAILSLPTMQEGLTTIDLRFQKPVLRPPHDL
jgi:hypothetical protein